MSKKTWLTIITLAVILIAGAVGVILAKGYTFSPKQGRLVGTGIISVSSLPNGASVYIDGHLTTATDTTISSLPPKKYKIKIAKEGYADWENEIEVREGLVSEVKATLFPALPTIYPLTYNGAINPTLSPDNQHIAFAVPLINDQHARQKGGVWVWTFESTPIAFARGSQPHQLIASSSDLDFAKATFRFSPDSKQLLVTIQQGGQPGEANQRNYLLDTEATTTPANLRDITPQIQSTLKQWDEDLKVSERAKIDSLTNLKARNVASTSASVKWSPDETKFMFTDQQQVANGKTPTQRKVYDLEKDKSFDLPAALSYQWLADSRHIILVADELSDEQGLHSFGTKPGKAARVSVIDFDGTNQIPIYSGNFDKQAVFPWSDGSKLVVLTTFPNPAGAVPNLFGINLK